MAPYTVTNNDKLKEMGHTDHDGTWTVRGKEKM